MGSRALSTLRGGVSAALGSHVGVLGDHLAELPLALFAVDDFRCGARCAPTAWVMRQDIGCGVVEGRWAGLLGSCGVGNCIVNVCAATWGCDIAHTATLARLLCLPCTGSTCLRRTSSR